MSVHCWHHDGMEYTTYPPFHTETCCWCGKRRTIGVRLTQEGHGPHLRGNVHEPTATDPGPCVRRVEEKP